MPHAAENGVSRFSIVLITKWPKRSEILFLFSSKSDANAAFRVVSDKNAEPVFSFRFDRNKKTNISFRFDNRKPRPEQP